jgi:class 3 adenylate cyclase
MFSHLFPSFPRVLETEFRQAHNLGSIREVRLAIFLSTFVYLGFYFWDRVTALENSERSLSIRLAVCACLLAVGLLPRSLLSKYLQTWIVLCVSIAGIGLVAILAPIHDGLSIGLGGVILIMMFNFGFGRLLFIPSLISGAIVCLGYNAAAVFSQMPQDRFIANNWILLSSVFCGGVITYLLERLFRSQFLISKDLELERGRTEELIRNLLPARIAARLRAGEKVIAESHGEATVLFADLVGFTSLTKRLSPGHLVEVLNEIFSLLDELTERHGVEKIKTIGDAYMVVAGAGVTRINTASGIADFALDMMLELSNYAKANDFPLALRVGISTGQVISGVIGTKKLSFDLWGDTVNLASRMESNSDHGKILVSETTYWRLHGQYEFSDRRRISVEGMGEVETYLLLGKKAVAAGGEPPAEPANQLAKPA